MARRNRITPAMATAAITKIATMNPVVKKEPSEVWLPPDTVEENIPNNEKKRKTYVITVITGATTAMKLAVKPIFLPDSNDKLTPLFCYLVAI
jgi:hypothetical protein